MKLSPNAMRRNAPEAMPIAIVGMGCRLPGGASSAEKLWDFVLRKQSARTEVPADRFNIDAYYHPNPDRKGTMNVRGGQFLKEDISVFDAPFFSISPAEAMSMDPMQRMLLEVVYEAVENAGIPMSTLAGTNTGCYIGNFSMADYDQLEKRDPETLPRDLITGTGQAILSNRISFYFDLQGPSVTLDTACSSSLVALHLACQSLRTGESTAAIVGATNAILNPEIMIGMTNLHFLSPDSTCYTFDSRANGYARGEGIAALVLKPLHEAVRGGDTIRAVIRGTAVNSNGKGPGITLPSREAQVRLINSAYEQAGCDPSVTRYCEAHGTGTQAGDPREAGAIGDTLGASMASIGGDAKVYVGSVKTNIGHLEGASGLAGLIKAVMTVENGMIAPNLWFEKGNPAIDFDAWRIKVPTEVIPWPQAGLRRASVNGFGYGGTNGHVIIDDAYHYMLERGLTGKHNTKLVGEQLPDLTLPSQSPILKCNERADSHTPACPRVFYISGHQPLAVANVSKAYDTFLTSCTPRSEDDFLRDLAFTLFKRRSRLEYGIAVVASSKNELIDGLRNVGAAERRPQNAPTIAYVFTGQGAQWWAMGRELMRFSVFSETMVACDQAMKSFGSSWSLIDEFLKDQKTSRVDQAEISQPLTTALQIGLVDLLESWNIRPEKAVGHSSGEIAAAYCTGVLSLESAMRVAYYRGFLSSKIKDMGYRGAMTAVTLSETEALKEIEAMNSSDGKVTVACVNSPKSVTLSGDRAAVTRLQQKLTSRNIFARRLQVETAYHSHHMLALAEDYRSALRGLEITPWDKRKPVAMFSSLTEREVTAEDDLGAGYWVDNMVSCARFSGALTGLCKAISASEMSVLVEIGPHSALAGPVKQVIDTIPDAQIRYMSAVIRGEDAAVIVLATAGSLFTLGSPVDLNSANTQRPDIQRPSKTPKVLVDLPSYAWNHSRQYWSESRLSKEYRFRPFPRTDILGARAPDWNPNEPRWRNFIRVSEQPWVKGHVVQGAVVYPAAGFFCMAIEAMRQMDAMSPDPNRKIAEYRVRGLAISRALVLPSTEEGVEVSFSMHPDSEQGGYDFWVFSYTDRWAEHCRGSVSSICRDDEDVCIKTEGVSLARRLQEEKEACDRPIDIDAFYAGLDSVGLHYGAEFRGITGISAGQDRAYGMVQVTDTHSKMPHGFEFDRLVHPASVDALFQACIAASARGGLENLTQPYVPVSITEMSISVGFHTQAGDVLQFATGSKKHGTRELRSNVVAMTESNQAIVMEGVRLLAIASDGATAAAPNHAAVSIWQPDVDLLSRQQANALLWELVSESENGKRADDLEMLAYSYLDHALREIDEAEAEHMHPRHLKFYGYLKHQRDLVLSRQHKHQAEDWTRLTDPRVVARLERTKTSLDKDDDYEGKLLVRTGEALVSILRNEIEPRELMMKDNLPANYINLAQGTGTSHIQVAKYVELLSHKYPDLDYLEIGAAHGGCTMPVLEALTGNETREYPRMKSYTYTDVSSRLLEQAADKFSRWASMMDFAEFNIEKDPSKQAGFEGRRFDVIIAANVLRATHDVNRTIRHTRSLLRPGGKLILLDKNPWALSVAIIFGSLTEYSGCSEGWREHGPLLSGEQWQQVLHKQGFGDIEVNSADSHQSRQCRVIVASAIPQSNGATSGGSPGPALTQAAIIKPSHEEARGGLIEALESLLRNLGMEVILCTLVVSQNRDLSRAVIFSFAELDHPVLANISPDELTALQSLVQEPVGLVWVTRGGIALGKNSRPELSLFHGLARSLRAENEGKPCITIDLDNDQQLPDSEAAEMVFKIFRQGFRIGQEHTLGVADREFSEQAGVPHIRRVIENTRLNGLLASKTGSSLPTPELQDLGQVSRPLQLKLQATGSLESLVFDTAHAAALSAHYVEVKVGAVCLNSRNPYVYNEELAGDDLGGEYAGIVTTVGDAVSQIVVGDRVAAFGPASIPTMLSVPASLVQKIPDEMSYASASSLPLALTQAYHALINVGRIREGAIVLIESACGGVGEAAVHIAKLQRARVFAVVSSVEQRQHLIDTSILPGDDIFLRKTPELVSLIRKATVGRGVDVVVQCSIGDVSHDLWDVVTPLGCFVSLSDGGDRSSHWKMPTSSNNVSCTVVDVFSLLKNCPDVAAGIFSRAMELVKTGDVEVSSPLMVEPFSKIRDSLQKLQDSKPQGKLVVEPREGDLVKVVPNSLGEVILRSDASYLLVGGLGGLGRSISRWMADKGARSLIYVSRGGAISKEARDLISELKAKGVHTTILQCDVADEATLSAMLTSALNDLPPLRGVIQGAMVLRDQVFANMTHDSFVASTRPKVQGSWSVHRATLDQPLDFFVLLSSCASAWGNAGQSNYVAGCAYQGALAAHRRALGLPATSFDVGKVAGVGVVAENTSTVLEQNLVRLGLVDVSEREFLAQLELAMLPGNHRDALAHVPRGHLLTGVHSTNDSEELPFWGRDPVFSHVDFARPHLKRQRGVAAERVRQQQPLPVLLGSADSTRDAEKYVQTALVQKLARVLMMPLEDIDPKRPMAAYGVDSLVAVDLRNWFSREAGVNMPVFDLLQAASLESLAVKVAAKSPLVSEINEL